MSATISDRTRVLTWREMEVLLAARYATDQDMRDNGGWFTPMDIGGEDGSDHSRILRRLGEEHFAMIDERFRDTLMAALGSIRAGRLYRITDVGRAEAALAKEKP